MDYKEKLRGNIEYFEERIAEVKKEIKECNSDFKAAAWKVHLAQLENDLQQTRGSYRMAILLGL